MSQVNRKKTCLLFLWSFRGYTILARCNSTVWLKQKPCCQSERKDKQTKYSGISKKKKKDLNGIGEIWGSCWKQISAKVAGWSGHCGECDHITGWTVPKLQPWIKAESLMESGRHCFREHSKKQVREQTAFDILRPNTQLIKGRWREVKWQHSKLQPRCFILEIHHFHDSQVEMGIYMNQRLWREEPRCFC